MANRRRQTRYVVMAGVHKISLGPVSSGMRKKLVKPPQSLRSRRRKMGFGGRLKQQRKLARAGLFARGLRGPGPVGCWCACVVDAFETPRLASSTLMPIANLKKRGQKAHERISGRVVLEIWFNELRHVARSKSQPCQGLKYCDVPCDSSVSESCQLHRLCEFLLDG